MCFLTFTLLDRKRFSTSKGYKTQRYIMSKIKLLKQCKNFVKSSREKNLVDFANFELPVKKIRSR